VLIAALHQPTARVITETESRGICAVTRRAYPAVDDQGRLVWHGLSHSRLSLLALC
jgi:hypothetical protein